MINKSHADWSRREDLGMTKGTEARNSSTWQETKNHLMLLKYKVQSSKWQKCWRSRQGQNSEVPFFPFKGFRLFSAHSGEAVMGLEPTSDMVKFHILVRLIQGGHSRLWVVATRPVVKLFNHPDQKPAGLNVQR